MLPSNWFENSTCKGCEYGERITGGVFCAMTQGLVPLGYQGCKAEHDYYEKLYKKENVMTLTELAKEIKKIIAFDYMTVHKNWCKNPVVCLWSGMPEYSSTQDVGGWESVIGKSHALCWFGVYSIIGGLNLSEYRDADGIIDYSKCIVEAER